MNISILLSTVFHGSHIAERDDMDFRLRHFVKLLLSIVFGESVLHFIVQFDRIFM